MSDPCGDCSKKTAKSPTTGETLCGPKGSVAPGIPECVCKGDLGCQSPCQGVQCPTGQACVPAGAAVGTCQPDSNCNFFGCKTGEACNNGACVDDPCEPNPCKADEVCKPNETFSEPRCVKSCAAVTCQTGEKCLEGTCTPTGCGSDCPSGQVCAPSGDAGGTCVPDKCQTDGGLPCSNGAWCDPATGACGNDPCTAIKCPTAQICVAWRVPVGSRRRHRWQRWHRRHGRDRWWWRDRWQRWWRRRWWNQRFGRVRGQRGAEGRVGARDGRRWLRM
ncbi:MAG: hypothetical protein U0263_37405 [Polyangiaceae bacterium]